MSPCNSLVEYRIIQADGDGNFSPENVSGVPQLLYGISGKEYLLLPP